MKTHTVTVRRNLFTDVIEEALVELSEAAERGEIPRWGSSDLVSQEGQEHTFDLHEGEPTLPGRAKATATITVSEDGETAEVDVSWDEDAEPVVSTPVRLPETMYERLRYEAHAARVSQAELVRRALKKYWEGG